jgi:hypothetical protein
MVMESYLHSEMLNFQWVVPVSGRGWKVISTSLQQRHVPERVKSPVQEGLGFAGGPLVILPVHFRFQIEEPLLRLLHVLQTEVAEVFYISDN